MKEFSRQRLFLVAKAAVLCGSLFRLTLGSPSASSQSPIFRGERIDYEVLYQPPSSNSLSPLSMQFVLSGDFDGDGRLDLLVVNDPCQETGGIRLVHLMEGGGIGSVSIAAANPGCPHPYPNVVGNPITFGNFDGDGRLDIAFWRARKLLHMSADGTFTSFPIVLPLDPTGSFDETPWQISADLNGDGLADVVVAQPFLKFDEFNFYFGTNLYVFLATGHGGFVRSQKIEAPIDPALIFYLRPAALGDFNGDGFVDFLGTGSGPVGSVEILTGDGAGHLSSPQNGIGVSPAPPLAAGDYSGTPSAIGDLNGDHLPDFVFGPSPGASVISGSVYLSTAVGKYAAPLPLTAPSPGQSYEVLPATIKDVDADGRPDIQVYGSGWVFAFLQKADGTFRAGPLRRMPLRVSGELPLRWDEDSLEDRIYYGSPLPSNVFSPSRPSLSVYLNHGSPNRDFADIDLSGEMDEPIIVSGDFDGDGHQDLASANKNGITLNRGNGRGGFVRVPGLTSAGAFGLSHLVTGDWNGDGRTDLLALRVSVTGVDDPGSLTLYLSQASSSPRFIASTTLPVGPRPIKGVSVDLNGDHKLDLMVGGRGVRFPNHVDLLNGTIISFLGDGAGGFAPGVPAYDLPSGYINPEFLDIEGADVDVDGIPDLVVLAGYGHEHATEGYWGSGHGDGTFEIPYFFGSTSGAISDPLLKPHDLNGDGIPDFLLSPTVDTGQLFSNVSTTFLGALESDHRFTVASDCCQRSGGFVDFDDDGFLDLVGVASPDSLRFGSGAGTGQLLRSNPEFSPSAFPFSSGIFSFHGFDVKNPAPLQADFDEDGRMDIATLDGLGHVRVLFNRANRIASDPAESFAETAAGTHQVDPEIDLVEVQGRVGAYDFAGTGTPQGALVLTLAINQFMELDSSGETLDGGILDRRDGSAPGGPSNGPGRLRPPAEGDLERWGPTPHLKSGTFQLFMNFGEPLADSNGDGFADLSLANAWVEPGLSGIPLADLTLNLRLDAKGPAFTGLHDINRFSSVDRDKGIATFVIPFEQMVSALTPAERASMDLGDGNGRLFLWAVSKLYGDQDRIPDTNDGADPTFHSEVREFRFPLADIHTTPSLIFGDVRIGRHLDGPLTLSNRGVRPVEITSMELPDPALTSPFGVPFSVPALGQLQLSPRFSPTAHARFSGNMHLESPALEQPISTFMFGRGVAPILQVTPLDLDLGSAPVGFGSPYQSVQVANVGDDYLEVSYEFKDVLQQFGFAEFIPPGGPHQFELYPGGKQTFHLAFHPAQVGAAEGIFQILSDDDLSPQVDVHLKGIGTPPEPRISISYYYAPIQDAPIGGEGSSIILIDNLGSAPLEIASVTSSNPLFTTSVSPNPIQPKQQGTLTVTYHPVAWGLETTTLTISHNDPTSLPVTRTIGGSAFEPPPVAQVTPTTLDFGSLHQGGSATLSFEIRNTGTGPLHLTGYNPLLASYCAAQTDLVVPAIVLPDAALRVSVTYTADIDKVPCSYFFFFTNDPALYQVIIEIRATILSSQIALDTYGLYFPDTQIGSTSTASVNARNLGTEPLIISSLSSSTYNSAFSLSTPLPLVIPPGGNADLEFVYSPEYLYGASDTITLYTNDIDNRQVYLYLYGYGLRASSVRSRSLNP